MCSKEELEKAAEIGANRALERVGLSDDCAKEDVKEIRNMLSSLKLFKKTFVQTTARVFTLAFWALLIGGVVAWFVTKSSGGH